MTIDNDKEAQKKAKRLMELGIEEHKICEGLIIHSKMLVKTIRRAEKIFQCPVTEFDKIDLDSLDNIVNLVYLLAWQRDNSVIEEDIEDIFDTPGNIQKAGEVIQKIFETHLKKNTDESQLALPIETETAKPIKEIAKT